MCRLLQGLLIGVLQVLDAALVIDTAVYHDEYTELAIQIPCTVAHIADAAGQDLALASPQMMQLPLCLSVQLDWSGAASVGIAGQDDLLGLIHAGKASPQATGH